jgi:hypothetical protein
MPANPRYAAVALPVVLHIVGATAFAILAPLQFIAILRRRELRGAQRNVGWPVWHRVAGRLLVVCGLVGRP